MLKKFVVILTCLGFVQLTSCTSKDTQEEGGEEMAIDASAEDFAEVEKVEGEQGLDIAAEDPAAALSDDSLPEDALGEAPPPANADGGDLAAPPELSEDVLTETAASEPPPPAPMDALPEDNFAADPLPADTLGGQTADTSQSSAPVPDEPVFDSAPPATESVANVESSKPKPVVSYRKMEQTPWKEGGKILNTMYVAREGDSWSSVSKMIYGSEKVAELKKMNPAIKGRKLKVGDKVYYNSPHRPDDETKVLTYFEDSGIAPEVYIAKSGDNLKKVAKELFGSEQGWKELYATNDFESKSTLDEGTQIKYWRSAPTSEVAAAQPAPPAEAAPVSEMPPAPEAAPPVADMPPPPPPMDQMQPPPPDMAANEMAPPPPPPPVEAVAPPPPPPPVNVAQQNADEGGVPLEDDQMTTLAAGAVVAVGLALFMIMRRRRKRELEQAIQDTQVG